MPDEILNTSPKPGSAPDHVMPVDADKEEGTRARRSRAFSSAGVTVTMVCVLLTYVLSMVPVGRMFMAGWIPCGGWQERTCRLIYLPLLHLTMRVEFIADGMLAYSTALKPLIPKSPSIRKASWWVTERSVYLQEGPGGIHDLQTNPAAQGKTPADLKDAIKRYLDFIRRSRLE